MSEKFMRVLPLILAAAIFASCVRSNSVYYVLEGGDGVTDFVEFITDSTCRFYVPGPLETICPYELRDDYIIVHVAPMSSGILHIEEDGNLTGQPPFFEGKWIKSKHK